MGPPPPRAIHRLGARDAEYRRGLDTDTGSPGPGEEDVSPDVGQAAEGFLRLLSALLLLVIFCARINAQTTRMSGAVPITLGGFAIEIDGHSRNEPGDKDGVRVERRVVRREDGSETRIY